MTDDLGPPYSLLDELDARQNDVLTQLDDLNHRIEKLLSEFARQSSQPLTLEPIPREKAA